MVTEAVEAEEREAKKWADEDQEDLAVASLYGGGRPSQASAKPPAPYKRKRKPPEQMDVAFSITRDAEGLASFDFDMGTDEVISVLEGGPAAKAGLSTEKHEGWIITHIDGEQVARGGSHELLRATASPGRTFEVRLRHPKAPAEVDDTAGWYDITQEALFVITRDEQGLASFSFDLDTGQVVSIDAEGPAARAGMNEEKHLGWIVTRVNGDLVGPEVVTQMLEATAAPRESFELSLRSPESFGPRADAPPAWWTREQKPQEAAFLITRDDEGLASLVFHPKTGQVIEVEGGGPAALAGMSTEEHAGWLITHVDGVEVGGSRDVMSLVKATAAPGRTFELRLRDPRHVKAREAADAALLASTRASSEAAEKAAREAAEAAFVASLPQDVTLSITRDDEGLAKFAFDFDTGEITSVDADGPASRAGLSMETHRGWIVTYIDGEICAPGAALQMLQATALPGRTFEVTLRHPDALRAPQEEVPLRKLGGPVAVFWDLDDKPPPRNISLQQVVVGLKSSLRQRCGLLIDKIHLFASATTLDKAFINEPVVQEPDSSSVVEDSAGEPGQTRSYFKRMRRSMNGQRSRRLPKNLSQQVVHQELSGEEMVTTAVRSLPTVELVTLTASTEKLKELLLLNAEPSRSPALDEERTSKLETLIESYVDAGESGAVCILSDDHRFVGPLMGGGVWRGGWPTVSICSSSLKPPGSDAVDHVPWEAVVVAAAGQRQGKRSSDVFFRQE